MTTKKIATVDNRTEELQKFLDSSQYTKSGIGQYEHIFGEGFISTGGIITTTAICQEHLDGKIKPGSKILDVGVGIGGGANFLSNRFNSHVTGVDLSSNMINVAKARYGSNPKLEILLQNILTSDFEDESFDLIYSRDSILHIAEKVQLFKLFFKWLKPGGILLITDYACGPKENWTNEFRDYLKQREYKLITVEEYRNVTIEANFKTAQVKNVNDMFVEALEREKNTLLTPENKAKFLAKYKQEDMDHLLDGWNQKLVRVAQNEQVWCKIFAVKPIKN